MATVPGDDVLRVTHEAACAQGGSDMLTCKH